MHLLYESMGKYNMCNMNVKDDACQCSEWNNICNILKMQTRQY